LFKHGYKGVEMKMFIILLIVFSLVFLSACQSAPEPVSPDPQPTKEPFVEPIASTKDNKTNQQSVNFIKSELPRETNPNVDELEIKTLAEDNTAFALAFYNQILSKDGNIIFSPFSISLALSMAMAGAETTTEQTMANALQFSLTSNKIHPSFNALLLAIEESQEQTPTDIEGSHFQLNMANSIWGEEDFEFKAAFLETLARQYGAGLFTVDFKENPEGARLAINDWVAEETEQKIRDIIPIGVINPFTRLVLANAIYFNGSWLYPFNENNTSDAPFYSLDGTESTVKMMHLYGKNLNYGKGENYQVVNLPYLSSDFSMTIILPNLGSFEEFEAQLGLNKMANILSNMSYTRADLQMPKFDFETDINANNVLIALGMGEAFDPEFADFSGITDKEDLFITDVLHKATITVDETGTEAAAATAVLISITSAMPEEAISIIIDRPFLFMIRHETTDTILFLGRVLQP